MPSEDHLLNYCECNLLRRIADGKLVRSKNMMDSFVFRPGNVLVNVQRSYAAHAADLRYHLFSLPPHFKNGRAFEGRSTRVSVRVKSGRSIAFSFCEMLFRLYGYRAERSWRGHSCVALSRGQPPSTSARYYHQRLQQRCCCLLYTSPSPRDRG